MRLVISERRPSLRTWCVRAAVCGITLGAVAYAVGLYWSQVRGDGEGMEAVGLLLTLLTYPWSLISMWIADLSIPIAYGALFVVAPILQCVTLAIMLWMVDAGIRRWRERDRTA